VTNQNPEQIARDRIDEQLTVCGYLIQEIKKVNLHAGIRVAVHEYLTDVGTFDDIPSKAQASSTKNSALKTKVNYKAYDLKKSADSVLPDVGRLLNETELPPRADLAKNAEPVLFCNPLPDLPFI